MSNIAQKLAVAVDTVLNLMDSGEQPRAAIVKTAASQNLLPDQVTRLCQLYNRSATLSQRLGETDLGAKLGEIQVVDPREVIKELTERQSSKVASLAISKNLLRLVTTPEPTPKVAASPAATVVAESPAPDRLNGLHHGLSGVALVELRNNIQKKIAGLQADGEQLLAFANGVANLTFEATKRSIEQYGNCQRIKQAQFWLANQQQEENLAMLTNIADILSRSLPSNKTAGLDAAIEPPKTYLPGVVGDHSLTHYVQKLGQAMSVLRKHLPEIGAKIAALREEDYLIKKSIRGSAVVNRDFVLGDQTLAERQMEHIRKVAGAVSSYLGSAVGASKPAPAAAPQRGNISRIDKFRLKLQHPQHEANLNAIRSRRALQELLVDDPVISSLPENDVIAAYNEISAYSPQAVGNTAVMRAVLRQYLQNNSSSFDLSQLRKLERPLSGGF